MTNCSLACGSASSGTPSAISHQLKLLKQFKLVKSRRDRKTIYYSLADDHVRSIIDMGREHIEEQQEGKENEEGIQAG